MKSYNWISNVREKLELDSDNKAAIVIGIHRSAVSAHKREKVKYLSEPQCEKVAEILGLSVEEVLIDQAMERASTTKSREAWKKIKEALIVVPRDGIEPPTRGFSIICSTD
jgi:ActR/RegA family two-component response regulator